MNEYILAFDVGTSGVKTSLFDTNCGVVDSVTKPHRTICIKDAYHEQSPKDWQNGVFSNTKILLSKNPDAMAKISAIGVGGIMLGCLPIGSNGEALYNCLIHSDHRAKKQYEKLLARISDVDMYNITGNISEARSSLCKMMWIKDNEPDIYSDTAYFVQAKDYIISKLTGVNGISDYSDASHAQLLNIKDKKYAKALLKEAGIDQNKMPELYKSTDKAGVLSQRAAAKLGLKAGIPIAVGAGDGACSAVGSGCTNDKDIYCCLGSTAWISALSDEPVIDKEQRVFNIISPDGNKYGVYGTVQSAGTAVEWVMDILASDDIVDFHSRAATILPGADGLIFLPYINGERSPVFDADAKGIFYGMSSSHTRDHFARAALEGVAYALNDVMKVFCQKHHYKSLRMIGGGAKSKIWLKIIADVMGISITTLNTPSEYATSLGTAIIAGTAAGIYATLDDAFKSIKEISTIVSDQKNHDEYSKYFSVYSKLYPAFKSIQKEK